MKRIIAMLPVAATAIALSMAPAAAQGWQGQNGWNNGYNNSWSQSGGNNGYQNNWGNNGWNNGYQNNGWNSGSQRSGWNNGYDGNNGWNSRGVSGRFSDPSYNSDIRFRASPNRCTEDLGYGRYEYCGW